MKQITDSRSDKLIFRPDLLAMSSWFMSPALAVTFQLLAVSGAQADGLATPSFTGAGMWHCPNGTLSQTSEGCYAQAAPPSGGIGGMQQQLLQQGAGIVGQAIGNAVLQSIFGNPQQNAANQAAAQAAAQKAALDAAKAAEQRKAADEEALRQQNLIKQRILGAIKEGTTGTPALGLMTGDEADAPLQVTRVPNGFGTTALVPVNTAPGSSAGKRLELMLGDDADATPISTQAEQGFDTAGKMQGSVHTPPPTPPSKPVAQNVKLLKDLKAKLKKNAAEVRSLNDQLMQLQQAPPPDPVAISQVQSKLDKTTTTNTQLTQQIQKVTAGESDIGFDEEPAATDKSALASSPQK